MGKRRTITGAQSKQQKYRPIFVTFMDQRDKDTDWRNRKKLRGTDIYLKEDLPNSMEDAMRILIPIHKEALRLNKKSNLVRDHIYIDGTRYTIDVLDKLPAELQLSTLSKKETPEHIFFWGKDHPFSNFHPCMFYENGERFVCAEQY